jgi:hypothetical protein
MTQWLENLGSHLNIFRKIMGKTLNPSHIQGIKGIGDPWLKSHLGYRRVTRISLSLGLLSPTFKDN